MDQMSQNGSNGSGLFDGANNAVRPSNSEITDRAKLVLLAGEWRLHSLTLTARETGLTVDLGSPRGSATSDSDVLASATWSE